MCASFLSVCMRVYLSVCLSQQDIRLELPLACVCVCVCVSVCLSVCLFAFESVRTEPNSKMTWNVYL